MLCVHECVYVCTIHVRNNIKMKLESVLCFVCVERRRVEVEVSCRNLFVCPN